MIKNFFIALLAFSTSCIGQEAEKKEKFSLQSVDMEKVSETLGHLIVKNLENPGVKFNVDKIIEGMRSEMKGCASPLTEEEYEQTIALIQETLFTELADKNLELANQFLEKNGKTEGIVSLNPKLQYQIVKSGEGETIQLESMPLIHYTGKLLDGTVFATSKESEQPVVLPLKQSIQGFCDGLVGMKEGEKRTLYIHPELAYGVSGQLPPNSLLIFDVEIIKANAIALPDATVRDEVAEAP